MPGNALVEVPFEQTIGETFCLGYIDFITTADKLPPALGQAFPANAIVVGDHKFIRSLDRAVDLAWDVQRLTYGVVMCLQLDAPGLGFYWNHVSKDKEPQCQPTLLYEDRATIFAKYDQLYQRVALPMWRNAERPPEDFPQNLSSCYAYNKPCPYMGDCLGTNAMQRIAARMSAT